MTDDLKPVNPIGQCFDSTGHQAMCWFADGKDFKVCHGIGIANMKGQEGQSMIHAWLEMGDDAFDTTWGVKMNAAKYRAGFKISYCVEYTHHEFLHLWVVHDYPGPWDPKIKKQARF